MMEAVRNRGLPGTTLLCAMVAIVAFSAAGCQSYDKLRSDDLTVGEDEVFAAGHSSDADDLLSHLHVVLRNRDRYEADVVVATLQSLATRGDPTSVPYVAGLIRDPDEEVRWHVAVALKAIGGAEAEQYLADMAASGESDLVREEAAGGA